MSILIEIFLNNSSIPIPVLFETGKKGIFKVFEILYPKWKFEETLSIRRVNSVLGQKSICNFRQIRRMGPETDYIL